ncbi:hypothetical protein LMORI2_21590 [Limnohabitans sp. MORI2]|uniref:hypothetical protein n=1 Tax=Limnohabitans sp. MORI2 TaxID=1751150 RepID=UPI00237740E7|nr:hypothetical protein [Limnohabitans sp. MORI2]BDU59177.1 hypothetical protein LMORI2_21590 [Limnohabitans sp. MORI2]
MQMMLRNTEYLGYLRERQASTSVGASTARGMGPRGTIHAARTFLGKLQIERFHKQSEAEFLAELDKATNELKVSLPKGAQTWGSTRKFLNIFLRGCAYNKYLSAHHKLQLIQAWLEVPLDSHVAKGLKQIAGRGKLPRWPGVIHLQSKDSALFQNFAAEVARIDGVNKVDLDVKFWRRVS